MDTDAGLDDLLMTPCYDIGIPPGTLKTNGNPPYSGIGAGEVQQTGAMK